MAHLLSLLSLGRLDAPCSTVAECLGTPLWHLPGPSPIVAPWNPNGSAAWMSQECEVAGGVTKTNATHYVFVYHCTGPHNSYRIGISESAHPLGPWTKPPLTPNLDVTKGAWDESTVASFNLLPDPEEKGAWLGFYEGGMGDGSGGAWTMGVARAPSPLGPWTKSKSNPVLLGTAVHDPKRCFPGSEPCNGIYVASVLHGAHTNGSYWVYMEAPINSNDEGPIALWSSPTPEGPFKFVRYVLDGGLQAGRWDSGRYSESRVVFQDGLFHLFMTASAVGGTAAKANKDVEQIGWAVSADGLHFSEYPHNPVVPQHWSTPLTSAMAEGHAHLEDGFVYVYHTIRWTTTGASDFAPEGRNAEDLGVEILISDPKFRLSVPVINEHWELSLAPGAASPCKYDWRAYRYCAALKTVMLSSGTTNAIKPHISFSVEARCGTADAAVVASIKVLAFSNDASVGDTLATLPLTGACRGGRFSGQTKAVTADDLPSTDFVVTQVVNAAGSIPLRGVTQTALYVGDGKLRVSV